MAQVYTYKRDPIRQIFEQGVPPGGWDKDKEVGQLLSQVAVQLDEGDIDLRPFCTETNQYQMSACAGNATADSVEIVYAVLEWLNAQKEGRPVQPGLQLSRLFVYAMARTLDGTLAADQGTYIRSCFEVLSRFGICSENVWPYDDSAVYVSPSIMAQRAALGNKIHSYYRIKSSGDQRLQEIIAALRTMRPVVFGTLVDEAFQGSTGDVIDRPKGRTIGGHAMIIVGYINGKFLVKNSWGKGWRMGGYAFFTPKYITWEETWDLWVPTISLE